jgi:hypothetical protein
MQTWANALAIAQTNSKSMGNARMEATTHAEPPVPYTRFRVNIKIATAFTLVNPNAT